jgi:hypothetical protein
VSDDAQPSNWHVKFDTKAAKSAKKLGRVVHARILDFLEPVLQLAKIHAIWVQLCRAALRATGATASATTVSFAKLKTKQLQSW